VPAGHVPTEDAEGPSAEAISINTPEAVRPTITIKSPNYGTLFNSNLVIVSGTVDDPTAVVTVNDENGSGSGLTS
jgi:hypothetical protein